MIFFFFYIYRIPRSSMNSFDLFCFYYLNFFFACKFQKISKWSNYKINLIDSIHANQLRLKICMAHSFFPIFFRFVSCLFRWIFPFSLNFLSKCVHQPQRESQRKKKLKSKLYKIFERLQLNLMEKKNWLMKTVSICWFFRGGRRRCNVSRLYVAVSHYTKL